MRSQLPDTDDFSSLFEFLPIGAYRALPDGTHLRANPALVQLNGYASEAEMLAGVREFGLGWYVDPQRRTVFRGLLERDGQVTGFESEIWRHKTRERIWISENAHVVRDAAGRIRYYEGTAEEITERVQAREALRRGQQQLQQIFDLVPGVIYRLVMPPREPTKVSFISPNVRALFGVPHEAVLHDPLALRQHRHPDDRPRVEAEIRAANRARRALDTEFRIVLDDGTVKWIHQTSNPAPAEDGNEVRVGLMLDITARKHAEQALRDNSELWKRALESAGDGVWDWHVDTGVEIFSPQCKALYGYDDDELPNMPEALDRLTHPDDVERMRQAREDHFAGRTPAYVNEHRVLCKNGQWKWILSRGIVISRDAAGRPLRMIGTHTDITGAKQAEALRFERDRAAAADQAKSQFLSRVSHELRTPLNAILGFAQLLELDAGANERQRGWIGHVLTSGRHLLALMDDILDISSVQTGELPMTLESLPLRVVVEETWAMLAAAAQEAGIAVIDEVPPGNTLAVYADRRRLKQVVSNLLSNAIKYNRPGGWVRVRAQAVGDQVELAVSDSGPGLDEAQQARLFQPFERLGAQHGPVAGTGLGLALSRQLTDAMGGTIEVDSRPGEGSTFRVRLPSA
ncbi:MAG: PAS domain-containing protein [Rubrivivax sp.]|nr:PAS domain-containing protein [Rubrivivax sp.]